VNLKELHSLIDSVFSADKTNGDLGKVLSQLKDVATQLHTDIETRDKTIADKETAFNDLKLRNDTLVEANGKMLIERTVTTSNPQAQPNTGTQEKEYTVDDLLYGED
jgi:hypothetical protein